MQIEAGKYYRTRDGQKVGPMERNDGTYSDTHPWRSDWGGSVRDDGTWSDIKGKAHPLDLIAEWADAPDLTAITTPYGLLDDATREALKAHGGPYERWDGGFWVTCGINPDWTRDVYRVKPQPPKPREWWCLLDAKRDKRIPFAWSTSREGAADMLGSDSAEIIHVREVTD